MRRASQYRHGYLSSASVRLSYLLNSVASMGMPELNKYAASYKKALSGNPDDSSLNSSIAMCYLKLSLYDQASAAFSQAIAQDFDNSELYFYEAICILKGKKAFKALRPDINKIEELLAAAISIEPRGFTTTCTRTSKRTTTSESILRRVQPSRASWIRRSLQEFIQ